MRRLKFPPIVEADRLIVTLDGEGVRDDSVHVHYEGDEDDDWHEVTLPKPGDETG